MEEKYINAKAAALTWGISLHRVQELCKNGRIDGVRRLGRAYMIPVGARKPEDARKMKEKEAIESAKKLPMPRKSPFLYMTDLYTQVGSADESIKSLWNNPEAQAVRLRKFILLTRKVTWC